MTTEASIRVVLADDNLIVREGVRALLLTSSDIDVVGVGGDYDELVAAADALTPQVVVTDIRMPPDFTDEGIRAARLIRKQHPGTGVVILSQYDEPEYAISLLSEGAAGYAYLLKDRVAEGDQLARAVREVSAGGSMLDPRIVNALTKPVTDTSSLSDSDERLLQMVAEGRPMKAIAVATQLHARGGLGRGGAALPDARAAGQRRARRARCSGCGCCTGRSSTARSRARASAACCPAVSRRRCASRASGPARRSDSLSRC